MAEKFDNSFYKKKKTEYNTSVDKDTASQIEDAKANNIASLKQAYVARQQNQKALETNLANAGIRGGMSETSSLGIANNYANQRTSINSQLAQSVKDINRTADANKLAYAQNIDTAEQQARENFGAEIRANVRADKEKAEQQKEANYVAKYSGWYDLKKLRKERDKTKDPIKKRVINARIGLIKQHKKGY